MMSITDLPDDVLCAIFDYFTDIETIYNTGLSCKRFMHLMQNNIHKPIDDKHCYKFFVIYADIFDSPYAFLYNYIRPFLTLCNYSFTSIVYKHPSFIRRLKRSSIARSIPDIDTELNKLLTTCKTINEIQNNPVVRALTESFDVLSGDAVKRIFDYMHSFNLILNDDKSPWRLVPNHFMDMNTFAGVEKFTIGRAPYYVNDINIRTVYELGNIDFSPLMNVRELNIEFCGLSECQLYDIANCKGNVKLDEVTILTLAPLSKRKQLHLNQVKIQDDNLSYLSNCDDLTLSNVVREHHNISALRHVKDLTITGGYIKETDAFYCDKLSLYSSSIETTKSICDVKRLIMGCVAIKPEDYNKDDDNVLFTSELLKFIASGRYYYNTIIQDLGKFTNIKFLSLNTYGYITSESLCKLKNVYALELVVMDGQQTIISLKGLDNTTLLWIDQAYFNTKFIDVSSLSKLKFLSFQGYDIDEGTIQQLPSLIRYNYNVRKENDTFDAFYERYQNGERW